jgi:hypothetical protein
MNTYWDVMQKNRWSVLKALKSLENEDDNSQVKATFKEYTVNGILEIKSARKIVLRRSLEYSKSLYKDLDSRRWKEIKSAEEAETDEKKIERLLQKKNN